MKFEREMFEAWCHIDDEFCTHRYTDNCQEYSDDYTQSAWLAWQASAQREGYKLVPVDKVMGCLYQIIDRSYVDDNVSELKAMIGVAE